MWVWVLSLFGISVGGCCVFSLYSALLLHLVSGTELLLLHLLYCLSSPVELSGRKFAQRSTTHTRTTMPPTTETCSRMLMTRGPLILLYWLPVDKLCLS